jgi:Protein of unknown function (DUF2568)
MGTMTFGDRPETGILTATPGAMNLAVRFVVEMGAYASFAYWGASTGPSDVTRVTLAVVAPLIAIVIWMLYLAPRARRRLVDPVALFAELAIFIAATSTLVSAGQVELGAFLGGVAVVNTVLIRVFGRQHRRPATV